MKRSIQTLCLVFVATGCLSAATACPIGKHPGLTAVKFITGIGPEEAQSTVFAYRLKDALARSARYC
jgi:hypothetical protein